MIRKGGRDVSEMRSEIEEDESQLEMEMERKLSGCERGQRKSLYNRERDFLSGPMRKQRYCLETREECGLQRRCMFREGKSAVDGDHKKSWGGTEAEGRMGWRLA